MNTALIVLLVLAGWLAGGTLLALLICPAMRSDADPVVPWDQDSKLHEGAVHHD